MPRKHLVIPDTQVKLDVPTEHLTWAGMYAAEKKPDVIVHLGDHWDMPSLSSYDKGKRSFENRRYQHDIRAGNQAMEMFLEPILAEQQRLRVNRKRIWKPRMVFCLGNHEYRIERAVELEAILEDTIGYKDLYLTEWEVYDFLEVVVVDGIAYSHYFTSGVMGRPVTSAKAMLTKKAMSCIMGHIQDRDIAFAKRADGTHMTGIHAGIFYQHDENYLTPQTNGSWKGIWMLHEVEGGSFDEMPVSLRYLEKKYG